MTLITGIRFNHYMGAMACDEERTTADGKRRILTSDKVEPCIPHRIVHEQRLAGAFGHSGSSAHGLEFNYEFMAEMDKLYDQARRKHGGTPESFLTFGEAVELLYDTCVKLKHKHMDDLLRNRFGLTTADYIQGYTRDDGGSKVPLKNKDVLKKVESWITHSERFHATNKIFFNRGIIVGYDPIGGVQIYRISLCEAMIEPVNSLMYTHGSGRDGTETVFAPYVRQMTVQERRGDIDPVEGMVMLLIASSNSIDTNIGVGGYVNLTLIDGGAEDSDRVVRTIGDERSKLASEISCAWYNGLFPRKQTFDLVDQVLFQDVPFYEVEDAMWRAAPSPKTLRAFLRGHTIA